VGFVGIQAIPDVAMVDDVTTEGEQVWFQSRIVAPVDEVAQRIDTVLEQVKWTSQHDNPQVGPRCFIQVHQALLKN
jgi:hypothetical protein